MSAHLNWSEECGRRRALALSRERDRFFDKIEKIPEHSCWEWSGSLDTDGYGLFHRAASPRNDKAHRLSWEVHNGPIPAGLCVLHRCDNRTCVRPDHLFLGTNLDNIADRTAKGRTVRAFPSRRHTCPHGTSPMNLCPACRATYLRAYKARKREQNSGLDVPHVVSALR